QVPDLSQPQYLNRYSYVLNNPTTHTDPTGHCLEVDDCTGHPTQSTPTYAQMLQVTYNEAQRELRSPEFQAIHDLLNLPMPPTPEAIAQHRAAAYAELVSLVREDGAWDMKSVIGNAFGIDQTGTEAAPIYFHMPGTGADTLTNANVFGN